MVATELPSPENAAEKFYGLAPFRIRRFILLLGVVGLLICLLRFGWVVSAGFLIGGIIAYLNHLWLERLVAGLGERITAGQSRERGGGIVVRAVLRYAFVAIGAYIMFRVSLAGLYGFLAGVCLTIAAIACEAAVEIYVGLRRGL